MSCQQANIIYPRLAKTRLIVTVTFVYLSLHVELSTGKYNTPLYCRHGVVISELVCLVFTRAKEVLILLQLVG